MPSPNIERDVRSFLRKLNYILRFISNLIAKAEPIFKLLKKNNASKWDEAYQEVFKKIKQYLSNPFVLVPPIAGRMDSIKYVFETPFIPGRIAKWQVMLSQYDIVYMTKKAMKGSVIPDLLAENPIDDYEVLDFEFPYKHINTMSEDTEGQEVAWEMYFDGAVNLSSNGIGEVLISLNGKRFSIAVKLKFECTNNVAEYEACVSGLQAAIEMKIKKLEVYGDSTLIIYQVKGEWQTRDLKLIPYQKYLLKLIKEFEQISFTHLSRDKNQFANALFSLPVMTQMEERQIMQLLQIKVRSESAYCLMIEEEADGNEGVEA
ncbi:uncharacterized protein LOC131174611 [Hevea brasiliensis]|uniref:uncharacterized protein LOC131174611 n=1 Tax=Hevea brasiliensis TaxID=3981 RepID=UPI0025CEEFB1|nr:uncharacterized protein LOC131174611 [Hevea brasiliensis]